MATEIKPKESEGINFILWIVFLCLLGSGGILVTHGERGILKTSGIGLFCSAFVFWILVRFYSRHKEKTIKDSEKFIKD